MPQSAWGTPYDRPVATTDLPVLGSDWIVRFRSFAQFLVQSEAHLANCILHARTMLRDVPPQCGLLLSVPDAPAIKIPIAIRQYCRDGRVGFAFRDRARLDAALRRGVSRIGARPVAPPPVPTSVLRADVRHAILDPAFTVATLARVRATTVRSGGPVYRPYVDILDEVLRSEQSVVCIAHQSHQRIMLWIRDGYLVAARRTPTPNEDRIGARLHRLRIVSDAHLRRALMTAYDSPDPLGQLLLGQGFATRSELHRVIRQQALSRAVEPCAWADGGLEVRPWSPPGIRADLIAVHRSIVIAHLVRAKLATLGMAEVEAAWATIREAAMLRVDRTRLSGRSGLASNEIQLLARPGPLDRYARSPDGETLRTLLLAWALGIIGATNEEPGYVVRPANRAASPNSTLLAASHSGRAFVCNEATTRRGCAVTV